MVFPPDPTLGALVDVLCAAVDSVLVLDIVGAAKRLVGTLIALPEGLKTMPSRASRSKHVMTATVRGFQGNNIVVRSIREVHDDFEDSGAARTQEGRRSEISHGEAR